jgi:hypothetical protein
MPVSLRFRTQWLLILDQNVTRLWVVTPPIMVESIIWCADWRRDPEPIDTQTFSTPWKWPSPLETEIQISYRRSAWPSPALDVWLSLFQRRDHPPGPGAVADSAAGAV